MSKIHVHTETESKEEWIRYSSTTEKQLVLPQILPQTRLLDSETEVQEHVALSSSEERERRARFLLLCQLLSDESTDNTSTTQYDNYCESSNCESSISSETLDGDITEFPIDDLL